MQIRIKGYTFTLSEPFQPGTVITKAEAQALNDLRAENIQNNLRKLVADATATLAPGELLSPETLEQLQTKLTEYDRAYKFVEKHQPRPRIGDIELEAIAIAKERVEAGLRQAGREATSSEIEALVEDQAKLPAVLELARARVAAKRRILSQSLSDL